MAGEILEHSQPVQGVKFTSCIERERYRTVLISFHPIQELPIESNPNCSVNWLTAQKVKKAKYHQFSVIPLVSFQRPFAKQFLGSDGRGKNTPK